MDGRVGPGEEPRPPGDILTTTVAYSTIDKNI
jgi:hypothetical protein